jgi:chemotaxis protein CheD
MEAMINAVLKSGCRRQDLEIKLFGGANLMDGPSMVGSKNAAFARDYLANEGVKTVAEDLGGPCGRRIHYTPATGKVQRLLLQDHSQQKIAALEESYKTKILTKSIEGEIELFG